MKILKEFRDFAVKGNVIDLAVGIIIGGAFGKIVTSFVNDVLMPPIGLLLGKVNFADLFIDLSGKGFTTLAEAKKAGAATIGYGMFINTIIDFTIVAFCVFLLIKQINRLKALAEKETPPADPTTKKCLYCFTDIPLSAVRCPHCTSDIKEAVEQKK